MTVIKKKKLEATFDIKYIAYKELKAGDTVVVGQLTEISMVKNFDPSKPDVPRYVFETDEGTVCLNSASELDKILKSASIGDVLEIIFSGKKKCVTNAGVPYSKYVFDVLLLEEEAA